MTPNEIRRLIAQSLDSPTCAVIHKVIMENKSPMSEALTDALYPSLAWRIEAALAEETASLKAHLKLRENCCVENEEMTQTFNMRWEADIRAIKRWQAAHPTQALVWPDHVDLTIWLLEELDAERGRAQRQQKSLHESWAAAEAALATAKAALTKIATDNFSWERDTANDALIAIGTKA